VYLAEKKADDAVAAVGVILTESGRTPDALADIGGWDAAMAKLAADLAVNS